MPCTPIFIFEYCVAYGVTAICRTLLTGCLGTWWRGVPMDVPGLNPGTAYGRKWEFIEVGRGAHIPIPLFTNIAH
jgi:hypothetical protein